MVQFMKPGKAVIVLSGRQAGKKAVIVQSFDDGTKARPYPHAIVAGIELYPLKITRKMDQKKIAKRSRIKPFLKVINYGHLMPTRYFLEVDVKSVVNTDAFKTKEARVQAKKIIRQQFEDRYNAGKNKWFFEKLRF